MVACDDGLEGWVVPEAMCRRFRELDSGNVDSRDNLPGAQSSVYCSTTRYPCSMTLMKVHEHDTSARTPVLRNKYLRVVAIDTAKK